MKNVSYDSRDPVGSHTLEVISTAGEFNKWMYHEFRDHLHGRVLEIGSGIGNISSLVLNDGFSLTLSDFDEHYLNILKERFHHNPNLEEITSIDLSHPDFEPAYADRLGKYDSIFLLNVIEHVENDVEAIRNCRLLLKENGTLVVLAPAYSWLYCNFDRQLGHYRRYRVARLARLVSNNGFSISRKKYFNFTGIAGWFVFGKLLGRKMLQEQEMKFFNQLVPIARFLDKITGGRIGLSIIVIGRKK